MFIEGYIDKVYLQMLRECGYDVVWSIETRAEAIQRGYSEFWPDMEPKDTIARIFVDTDMEDLLTPAIMSNCSVHNMIPLMAVSENERLRNYAKEQLLKEDT